MDAETLAQLFHSAYETLAPEYGYETRKESAVPWTQLPEPNKQLMIAVAGKVLEAINNEVSLARQGFAFSVGSMPLSVCSGALQATTGHTSQSQLYSIDTNTNAVTPVLDEDRVCTLIAGAIAASEDRLVERIFKMLTDRLRIQRGIARTEP